MTQCTCVRCKECRGTGIGWGEQPGECARCKGTGIEEWDSECREALERISPETPGVFLKATGILIVEAE